MTYFFAHVKFSRIQDPARNAQNMYCAKISTFTVVQKHLVLKLLPPPPILLTNDFPDNHKYFLELITYTFLPILFQATIGIFAPSIFPTSGSEILFDL